jgi:hypothetical protein
MRMTAVVRRALRNRFKGQLTRVMIALSAKQIEVLPKIFQLLAAPRKSALIIGDSKNPIVEDAA